MLQVIAYATQARIPAFEILLPVERFAAERQASVPPEAAAGAVPAAPPSRTFKLLRPSRRGRCRDRVGRGLPVQAVCWAGSFDCLWVSLCSERTATKSTGNFYRYPRHWQRWGECLLKCDQVFGPAWGE